MPYRLPRESNRYASTDQPPLSTPESERHRDRIECCSFSGSRLYFQNYMQHLVTFKLEFLSEYASARQTRYTCVIPKTSSKFLDGVIFLIFYFENLDQALILLQKCQLTNHKKGKMPENEKIELFFFDFALSYASSRKSER